MLDHLQVCGVCGHADRGLPSQFLQSALRQGWSSLAFAPVWFKCQWQNPHLNSSPFQITLTPQLKLSTDSPSSDSSSYSRKSKSRMYIPNLCSVSVVSCLLCSVDTSLPGPETHSVEEAIEDCRSSSSEAWLKITCGGKGVWGAEWKGMGGAESRTLVGVLRDGTCVTEHTA